MRTLKLTIEYDGSDFYGWQKQKNRRTVQGVLEEAFLSLTGEKITIEGSGRTDKGVHALGQVASVVISNPIPLKNLKVAINNLLPKDVVVKKVERASDDFHARFSAKKKTYIYVVQVGGQRSAIQHNHCVFCPYSVDLQRMKETAKLLVGRHNFKGFCSSATNVTSFEREIFDIKIKKNGRIFTFEVCGSGFLYNMVRILVGTLLDVGRGKLNAEDVRRALESGERKFAGKTMESCGLFLKSVEYV